MSLGLPEGCGPPAGHVEELPSATRTIVGVPSSIAAFVGYTVRGLDHRATPIHNFADFERAFGGLDRESELGYAVQQFFLNGGTDAHVVRVPRADSRAAKINLKDGTASGAKVSLEVTALSNGAWGNAIVMDVDHDGIPAADTKAFNLTVSDLATGATERFSGVTIDTASSSFAETVVNDPDSGSKLVSVKVPAAATARPADAGSVGGDITMTDLKNDKPYSIKATSDVPTGVFADVAVTVIEKDEPLPSSIAGVCALVERKITLALSAVRPGARCGAYHRPPARACG